MMQRALGKYVLSKTRSPSQVFVRNVVNLSEDFAVYPREVEGNISSVNWSLTVDGVVPVGNAYRNGRVSLMTSKLNKKAHERKIELEKPSYFGKYVLSESGDSLSHSAFNNFQTTQQSHFESSGMDLFVEDAGLGALSSVRLGVRVVSDQPALALIARTLLVKGLNSLIACNPI